MMGESEPAGSHKEVIAIFVIIVSLGAMALVAGAAGTMADGPTTGIDTVEQETTLANENEADSLLAELHVGEDGIEIPADDDGEATVEVLASEVYDASPEDRDPVDVVFVPEMSPAMHGEWGTHYPGSGTVDDLLTEDVLEEGTVMEQGTVEEVEDEGIGLNMRGIHQYDCDEYDPWYYIFSDPDPWCGWHSDMGSPDGDTDIAYVDYRTLDLLDLDFQTGQDTFDYQVYNDESGEWVDLPRGSGDTYWGVGQGYWEWTSDTDERLLDLTQEQHESLYHVDLRAADLPLSPDINDWAFDLNKMEDEHVRVTYDKPLTSGGQDRLLQEPVDPWGERFTAMLEITETLNALETDSVGLVVNDEERNELGDPEDAQDIEADMQALTDDIENPDEIEEALNNDIGDIEDGLSDVSAELAEMMFNLDPDDPELEGFDVWDGVETADQLFDDSSDSEQVIVVLSDGIEPQSPPGDFWDNLWDGIAFWQDEEETESEQLDESDERVEELIDTVDDDVTIHTLGLGDSPDHWRLERLAEETGGEYRHVDEAADLAGELSAGGGDSVDFTFTHSEIDIDIEYPGGIQGSAFDETSFELDGESASITDSTSYEQRDQISFTLDASPCTGTGEELDSTDETFGDITVTKNHHECDSTGTSESISMDSGDVFVHGDEVSAIDDHVPTDGFADAPSEVIPDDLTEDGNLSMPNQALVAMPVDEDDQQGYVLLHVESDDPTEAPATNYEVEISNETLDSEFEDLRAGESFEVPININNTGEKEDDDGNTLSERVSAYFESDAGQVQIVSDETVEADEDHIDNPSEYLNITLETGERHAGLSGDVVASSERDSDREYQEIPAADFDLGIDISVIDDDGVETDTIDVTQKVNDSEAAPVIVTVSNDGPEDTPEGMPVAFSVGDTLESQELDDVEPENNGNVTFGWEPGVADLGLDDDELTGSGEVDIELEASAGGVTETEVITGEYDFDAHTDIDLDAISDEDGALDPISIDIDEVEFDS